MAYYLGVDLGTSAVKVVLADDSGNIASTAREGYPCIHPRPGWSEQDPGLWYRATVSAVREAVESAGIPAARIEGMSFGGQMHGLVALDRDGAVIRPAILWNDGRSAEECAYLNDVLGREELTRRCGNIAFPGFTAPKILWMRAHEPELFSRMDKVLLPKDYLVFRMTGRFCTDVSDASGTLYFDVRSRTWSAPMLDLLGISPNQLPQVLESAEVAGTLLPEAARVMGLGEHVRVIAGAGDNAAAAVGMGVVHEGQCNVSLGTSGTVFLPTRRMLVDEGNSLHSFADAAGAYHLMGCMLSAASANDWWATRVLESDVTTEMDRVGSAPLGCNEVLFLPYLMGERSPVNDVDARAAFIGMNADTGRAEMGLAVLEGVTFALRQCLDAAVKMGVSVETLTVCGGGAKSHLWRRVIADVFEMPVSVLPQEEGPGFGACLLAMVGCGAYPTVGEAVDAVVGAPRVAAYPNEEEARRYRDRYRVYCELYPRLKDVFADLRELVR